MLCQSHFNFFHFSARIEAEPQQEVSPECCVVSVESGKTKCCKSKKTENQQIVKSDKSELLLGVIEKIAGKKNLTRMRNVLKSHRLFTVQGDHFIQED